MARYIDVEALKNDGHPCWHDGEGNIYYEVDHAPTADVVAVVRCKDCRNRIEKNWAKCAGRKPDDFCSDGIRRFK